MATKLWTGNALAVAQIQTFAPGAQLPGTVINATINGKTASYTSASGTNDDLIAGLIKAIAAIVRQAPEFAEISFAATVSSPAVPAPNATYLQMASQSPGIPFEVAISLTQPAKVSVTRVAAGTAAVNEVQQITISPNAESGSSFTLTWGGHTTNAIPIPPSAPSAAAGSAGTPNGSYKYACTFVTANGETELGLPTAAVTLTSQEGSLSSIPTGPSGTTARVVYRTKAGGTTFFKVGTISDNTTTTYTDNNSDTTIGANPSPPPTNGCLQGELEALSGVGQGNVKVSGAATPAYAGQTMPTSTVVYTIEFRGSLGGASQALVSGNVANVTILPPVSISTVTAGCPPQSEIQTVGWQQVIGTTAPTGTFTITLPGLGVSTAAILQNASAATVQAALVAAAGPAYANAFTVTLTQSTTAGYLYQISYASPLAMQAVPLATVDVSKLVAATGDTVTGYQTRTQKGTSTGRNSTITVTLQNGPSGGTFGLTGTLAGGNTISASSVAYNATAATLAGDFPANTVSATGSAGGPYTIEAIGEAASQAVTWTATSSLTATTVQSGSPPGSNTAGVDPPVVSRTTGTAGGALATGTYYYKVTAVNTNGETTGTEIAQVVTGPTGYVSLSWASVPTATSYNVYRGTASGSETTKLANITGTAYTDYGGSDTSASPPGSNTSHKAPPVLSLVPGSPYGSNAAFPANVIGTASWNITAIDSSGETTASNQVVVYSWSVPVELTWTAVPGATGYKVYRTGGEGNGLVATLPADSTTFVDVNAYNYSNSPSGGSGTAAVLDSLTAQSTGGVLAAGTYYYKVQALINNVATPVSNELSVTTTGDQSYVELAITMPYNGNSLVIYRGTSAGGENVQLATIAITPGGQVNWIDTGAPTPTSASAPGSNTTAQISAPTQVAAGTLATGGALSAATYYYKITATAGGGETTASNEESIAITAGQVATLNWNADSGATGYKVYRGTVSGSENVLVATINSATATSFEDSGPVNTSNSPPSSNGALIAVPTQNNASTSSTGGNLATNTYYYEVTAYTAAGETTVSNEKSIAVTGPTGEVTVSWNAVTGADGYRIYRGTSTGGENALIGVIVGGSTTSFVDVGTVFATFAAAQLAAGAAAVNEQQLVTLVGAIGGTFVLAFEGQGTGAIAYGASAATVQSDLQALSTVGSGNVTVSGSAGGPFTVTGAGSLAAQPLPLVAANGSNLTGTATVGQSLTTTQAATGPNFWDNANNWSPIGVPANGDSVYFQNSTVDCLYNLAQSSTTLANLQIDMSYVGGQIGLPSWNGKYYEYRQQYLQIGVTGTILIGSGKGSGPTLVKLDTGTNATTFLINGCGTSLDPTLPAILWKGNRSSGTTTINISKGALGIAVYAGETATVDQINQGYVTNVKSDSSIFVGPGVTINTEWYMTGGQGTLNAACPTLVMENGTLTILDGLSATAVTTLTVVGGSVSDRSTGTISTLTVGTGATYDRSDDSRAKTVTTCTISGKSTFLDPNDTITFTNPLTLSDCSLLDVTLDLGTNITLSRQTPGSISTALQDFSICQGRLTLTSGTPITTLNVTGASTIYFTPFMGDQIALYNGTIWASQTFSETSLALSGLTTGLPYDVFAYLNSGVFTLEAVAWSSSSARATALALQNGIYVKNSAPSHRYLGTFIATGATTTEDSTANRYLWNYYHRVGKWGSYTDSTSHTYSTNAWRIWDNNSSAKINFCIGVVEDTVFASVVMWQGSAGSVAAYCGLGFNSTSSSASSFGDLTNNGSASGSRTQAPALGGNYVCPLENAVSGSPSYTYTELYLNLKC